MRSGPALIKLAKHKIENVRKLIALAEEAREACERQIAELDEEEARERAAVRAQGDPAGVFAAFVRQIAVRRRALETSIRGCDDQIATLRVELARGFEELKRFELLEERRVVRESQAAAARERALLDEAAIARAARR